MNLMAVLLGAVGLGQGKMRWGMSLPGLRRLGGVRERRSRRRGSVERIPRERRRGMPRRAYRHGVFGGLRLKEERRKVVRVVRSVSYGRYGSYGQA